jgi:prepilin-type N-terminal cleavage/methylation domain-containing protein
MKFALRNHNLLASGFTLVELLAAMAFMAIVIPVAVEGLRIANRAGVVGQRKAIAARVADRMLNEYVVTSGSRAAAQRGVVNEGPVAYQWTVKIDNWREDTMRLATCEVTYPVQGKEFSVRASTLLGMETR